MTDNNHMEKGLYTAFCSNCEQPNYMEIDGEVDFDSLRCRSCKLSITALEKGEENDEYIAIVEEPPVPKEEPKNKKQSTKNTKKESFKLKVKEETAVTEEEPKDNKWSTKNSKKDSFKLTVEEE